MKEKSKLRQFFDDCYGGEISDAEYAEYKWRLTKFFELLIEVDKREKVLERIESGELKPKSRSPKINKGESNEI